MGDQPAGPRPGVLLEVSQGPVKFDAWRDFHSTRVLVAYTTAKLDALSTSDCTRLKELGFLLPLGLDASNSETSEAIGAQANFAAGTTGAPVAFKPEACGNRGNPIRVEWEGQEDAITDGFGLCSPARWPPMNRGHRLKPPATAHAQSMYRDACRVHCGACARAPPLLLEPLGREGRVLAVWYVDLSTCVLRF